MHQGVFTPDLSFYEFLAGLMGPNGQNIIIPCYAYLPHSEGGSMQAPGL